MPFFTRRRALRTTAVGATLLLAGCSRFQEPAAEETAIERLSVANFDDESRTVHVLLQKDGEPVYYANERIDARDQSTTSTIPGHTFDDVPNKTDIKLYTWRDEQPRSEWEVFDTRSYETPCVKLSVHVGDTQDNMSGNVSIWRSFECEQNESAE
ncbi:hypothetical protein [Natronocalculus amylovorans]|uniref:Uncharacterized protein n=1 Tax=Natronocalculus amylovorans TaxID=2917812 RepID=A0AAE3K6Z1_9EURY|nr:hypothetical protein [Natronocalculus amylovorans]MCL9815518.1 hypothetical protein [Natronocalculus amylovorans]NUE01968.1 hypothetical protein [Halorubraceae archaeon YAN]